MPVVTRELIQAAVSGRRTRGCESGQTTGRNRGAKGQNGRSERIRTSDPLVPNEVRYQAALHSDIVLRCRGAAYTEPATAQQAHAAATGTRFDLRRTET